MVIDVLYLINLFNMANILNFLLGYAVEISHSSFSLVFIDLIINIFYLFVLACTLHVFLTISLYFLISTHVSTVTTGRPSQFVSFHYRQALRRQTSFSRGRASRSNST